MLLGTYNFIELLLHKQVTLIYTNRDFVTASSVLKVNDKVFLAVLAV